MQPEVRKRLVIALAGFVVIVAVIAWVIRARLEVSGSQLAAALPAGASTVLFLDFQALRHAGILDRIAGGGRSVEDPEYRAFVQGSGFDYRRDLDTAALGFQGDTIYMALRGRFNWADLRNYAAAQKGRCEGDYCHMPASQAGRVISFYPARATFWSKGSILAMAVGPGENSARSVGLGGVSSAASPPVPSAPVWLATTGAALKGVPSLPSGTVQFARLLAPAERLVLALEPAQGNYQATLEALYATPQEAAVTLVQLEGLTSMLRKLIASQKMEPNPKDLSGILTGGSFRKEDRRVMGQWPVRREFLDSLAGGP